MKAKYYLWAGLSMLLAMMVYVFTRKHATALCDVREIWTMFFMGIASMVLETIWAIKRIKEITTEWRKQIEKDTVTVNRMKKEA